MLGRGPLLKFDFFPLPFNFLAFSLLCAGNGNGLGYMNGGDSQANGLERGEAQGAKLARGDPRLLFGVPGWAVQWRGFWGYLSNA